MPLPTFALSARVNPQDAKQDRIDLTVGDWIVVGDTEMFPEFFARLGPPPAHVGDNPHVRTTDDDWGDLLNRPSGRHPLYPEFNISSGGRGRSRRTGAPLFRGTLRTTNWNSGELLRANVGVSGRRLFADLSLNPTRFIVHQPHWRPRPGQHDPASWRLPEPTFQTRRIQLRNGGEFPLDLNDNVLIFERQQMLAHPLHWPAHLDRYFAGVIGWTASEITRAAQSTFGTPPRWSPYLNLRTAETYFEFSTNDPIGTVTALAEPLSVMGTGTRRRTFPDGWREFGFHEIEQHHNALSTTTMIRAGTLLRVYAKTNRRVRLEIIHSLPEVSSSVLAGHTTNDARDMLEWLNALAIDAADTINMVLADLERLTSRPTYQHPAYLLLRLLFQAARSETEFETLLSALIHNRCIRLGDQDQLRPAVITLQSAGVLQRLRRHSRTFVPDPRFQRALGQLSGREPVERD